MRDLFARKGDAAPLAVEQPGPALRSIDGGLQSLRQRRVLRMAPLGQTGGPCGATAPADAAEPTAPMVAIEPSARVRQAPVRRHGLGQTTPKAEPKGPAKGERRRFTFRLDQPRHAAFVAEAGARGMSRQRLLTEILDARLASAGWPTDAWED